MHRGFSQKGRSVDNVVVAGVLTEAPFSGQAAQFIGRIANLDFDLVNGDLTATGRLIGDLIDPETGNLIRRISQPFEAIISDFDLQGLPGLQNDVSRLQLDNGCPGNLEILRLEIGPIFLNLLGLIVEVPDYPSDSGGAWARESAWQPADGSAVPLSWSRLGPG